MNASLENVFKKVLTDIRFQVNSKNLNIKKLWINMGFGMEKELDMKEFNKFLKYVVPNMAQAE